MKTGNNASQTDWPLTVTLEDGVWVVQVPENGKYVCRDIPNPGGSGNATWRDDVFRIDGETAVKVEWNGDRVHLLYARFLDDEVGTGDRESGPTTIAGGTNPWKVIIVDDEPQVQVVTQPTQEQESTQTASHECDPVKTGNNASQTDWPLTVTLEDGVWVVQVPENGKYVCRDIPNPGGSGNATWRDDVFRIDGETAVKVEWNGDTVDLLYARVLDDEVGTGDRESGPTTIAGGSFPWKVVIVDDEPQVEVVEVQPEGTLPNTNNNCLAAPGVVEVRERVDPNNRRTVVKHVLAVDEGDYVTGSCQPGSWTGATSGAILPDGNRRFTGIEWNYYATQTTIGSLQLPAGTLYWSGSTVDDNVVSVAEYTDHAVGPLTFRVRDEDKSTIYIGSDAVYTRDGPLAVELRQEKSVVEIAARAPALNGAATVGNGASLTVNVGQSAWSVTATANAVTIGVPSQGTWQGLVDAVNRLAGDQLTARFVTYWFGGKTTKVGSRALTGTFAPSRVRHEAISVTWGRPLDQETWFVMVEWTDDQNGTTKVYIPAENGGSRSVIRVSDLQRVADNAGIIFETVCFNYGGPPVSGFASTNGLENTDPFFRYSWSRERVRVRFQDNRVFGCPRR